MTEMTRVHPVEVAGQAEEALQDALRAEAAAREAAKRADLAWRAAAARVVTQRAAARAAVLAALDAGAEEVRLAARDFAEMSVQVEARRAALRRAFARGLPPLAEPQAAEGRVVRVWDPVVRLFHWGLVGAFLGNALFTEPGKAVHVGLGYGVAGLIALRVIWGFVGTRHARFADFLPRPSSVRAQVADMVAWRRRPHAGHSPLGAVMIFNLLLTMAGLALTGHALTTVTYFGVQWMADLHESLVIWAGVSVALHVLAVGVESLRLGVNLPLSMITGKKRLP